ncbi:D-2-hydroxyacid dehydrogenase [Rubrobacter naiadicus]|uniref:D-2-hydroxyacid dehydrogenase n=1 Tax=Rubrobacter naiadicus TaxID=1392641 RepID=UPI00236015D8|nr:D-2-hydroxyacid dehydrogenase [Rubrobacter naiadicus]
MVKVAIASYLPQDQVQRIEKLDPAIEVLYDPEVVPPPRWPGDHVGPADWIPSPAQRERLLGMLAEAEVLYDFPREKGAPIPDLPALAPRLRWVQGSMAGAGEVAKRAGLLESEVVVTTASGVYSPYLAEFVLLAMLAHAKRLFRLQKDKAAKRWNEEPVDTLEGKTLCIVGLGNIGRAIASRARPFGMHTTGVKRTVREDDPARGYADELYATEDLHEALSRADYVAVTLPATPETIRLIDRRAISAMRRGAYFINVGRGSVVDEGALVEALREGHLSGAALDVFETEPLPAGSPLWEMDEVIVSPHATDNVPEADRRQTDLFCENLRRYLAGEPLENQLDKELLY